MSDEVTVTIVEDVDEVTVSVNDGLLPTESDPIFAGWLADTPPAYPDDIPDVPTKTSDLTNDSGFITDSDERLKRIVQIKVNGDSQTLSTSDGKFYFPIPLELNGYYLTSAQAGVSTVSSSGLPTFQINNVTTGNDMLSTRITIDVSEYTSYTALTPSVINATYKTVSTGNILRIDCDVSGTGTKGATIILTFEKP